MFYLLVVIVRGHVTVKPRLLLAVLQFAVCTFAVPYPIYDSMKIDYQSAKVNFDSIFTAVKGTLSTTL